VLDISQTQLKTVQAANFESAADGTSQQDAAANDDTALMRFELIEIIVRIAFSKYIIPREATNPSSAVKQLLINYILPGVPPLAFVDPNEFRFRRMYNEATESVLVEHCDFLLGIFKVRSFQTNGRHISAAVLDVLYHNRLALLGCHLIPLETCTISASYTCKSCMPCMTSASLTFESSD
jgi:hypothetical protein